MPSKLKQQAIIILAPHLAPLQKIKKKIFLIAGPADLN
jgi:hypothetical protein